MRHILISFFLFILMGANFSFAVQDNCAKKNQIEFSALVGSTVALPNNPRRCYLLIQNKGAAAVYLSVGAAGAGTTGIFIPVGGNYEPGRPPVDALYLNSTAGAQTVLILEGQE